MSEDGATKIVLDPDPVKSPIKPITSDISIIKRIITTNPETKVRKDAAIYILKLIEDGQRVDADHILSLYKAEKDIGVATELKRALNKLNIINKFQYDPVSSFDKNLSPADEEKLLGEIAALKSLYDKTVDEKGAFERKYRIFDEKPIEGGMGRIFKGIRLEDERPIAVKFLMAKELSKRNNLERIVARFRREGELLTNRLKHPHIVEAFEYGEADGEYFIVMEFLNGGTLEDKIMKEPFSFDIFKGISIQLCDAVAYMHRNGFIHRDIKPANILVTETNGSMKIKICDFGLVKDKQDTSLSKISFQAGTDDYSSPQQLTDTRTADERDDIFSMGKTFYAMLTGAVFVKGTKYKEIKSLNNTVPKGIDPIIMQCVDENKANRFQSVTDLREAIFKL